MAVELQLLDRMVHLVDEGFDLAVRIGPLADSTMIAVPVGTMRRVVCASPELLRRSGTPQHPTERATRPCMHFRGIAPTGSWTFDHEGAELEVAVSGRCGCNQAWAAAEACARGLGFGLFLAYQVQPHIEAGRLALVLEAFEPTPLPISLVYPQTRLVSARLRALLDWLKNELRTG